MTTDTFSELVEIELQKARKKHRNMQCPHEAYAVILEEVDEFWLEVKSQQLDRAKALKELVQIATMCRRAAEDLEIL